MPTRPRRPLARSIAAGLSSLALLALPVRGQDPAPVDSTSPAAAPAPQAPPAAPAPAPAKPPARAQAAHPGRRVIDRDSPVARKLAEKLTVDPHYATDGTVELTYVFPESASLADWEITGLDRAQVGTGPLGRERQPALPPAGNNLSLGANTSSRGVMLHTLSFAGDYEMSVRCRILRSTTHSDLVFLAGPGGASFGSQLVQRGPHGFSALARSTSADRDAYAGGRVVEVTLTVRQGAVLETSINHVAGEVGTAFKERLDGRPGIYLGDMHLLVDRIIIRGRVDPSKL